MFRYKATASYDGSGYFGWQQTISGLSIQEELKKALFVITRQHVLPEAASRTDKGVHAEGQIISFDLTVKWVPKTLQYKLNQLLPVAIRIVHLEETDLTFHPTLDATQKTYRYQVSLGSYQHPMERLYSWHVYRPLDVDKILSAKQECVGTHNFLSFTTQYPKNPFCRIDAIDCSLKQSQLTFLLTGDRFLYKMVRILVGTLIEIGTHRIPPNTISHHLLHPKKTNHKRTAPPHGLTLVRVDYAKFSS